MLHGTLNEIISGHQEVQLPVQVSVNSATGKSALKPECQI